MGHNPKTIPDISGAIAGAATAVAANDSAAKLYDFKSVAVFMGSSKGFYPGTKQQNPLYEEEARKLGGLIGQAGYRLVYGGGNAGLMGTISETVLQTGGTLCGVLSTAFTQADESYIQRTHPNAQEILVEGIEVRKWEIIKRADAFFAFPGGLGTLDELVEAGVEQYQRPYKGKNSISKPIIILNIDGVFDPFKDFLDGVINRGFAQPGVRDIYYFASSVEDGFNYLQSLQGQPRLAFDKIGNVERCTEFKGVQAAAAPK